MKSNLFLKIRLFRYAGLLKEPWVLLVFLLFVAGITSVSKAQNITRPNIIGPSGTNINSYTGNLYYQRTDLMIPGRGLSLDITFSYNSASRARDGGFGFGWTFSYNQQYTKDITRDSTGITIYQPDGRRDYYRLKDKKYNAPKGIFEVLTEYEPGKIKLTAKNGTQYFFENPEHKKITRIRERNGNEITLIYSGNNLTTITDGADRKVIFTWTNNRLSQVRAEAGSESRTVKYEYNNSGCLVKVENPRGDKITYAYGANRVMNGLTDANGNATNITYNSRQAVTKIISCQSEQNFSYNTTQRKTYVIDKNEGRNLVTTYEFDVAGNLIKKAGNCCGNTKSYTYDPDNNINQVTDANGGITLYTYDNQGDVLSETDPMGKAIRFTYEPVFKQVSSITDKNGNKTSFIYDARGNIKEIQRPLNVTLKFTYAENGDQLSATNDRNFTTTYTYDKFGYVKTTSHPDGGTEEFTYDAWGNLQIYKDQNKHQTTYAYDVLNQLISTKDALNGETKFKYDGNGNIISEIDANGHETEFAFDAKDNLIQLKDALGNVSTITYDALGNTTAKTDPNGHTTRYLYNDLNQLISETNATGEETTFTYDGFGNRTSVTLPNGNIINTRYDALNRGTEISDKQGIMVAYTYDANSYKLSETDALGNTTTFRYDALNRIITQSDPLGNSYSYAYDGNGNIEKETDRNGNTTTYKYNALDRLLTKTDALNNQTIYSYDKAGNLLSLTDAKGNKTEYTYDALDQLKIEKFADNTTKSYTYDAVGNQTSRTDNKGQVTKYTYDNLGRPITRIYPNTTETFTYDARGQLLSAKNPQATVTFTYDAANRVTSETLNGITTGYSYNTAAGIKKITYPGGRIIQRELDGRFQLRNIKENGSFELAQFDYDAASRVKARKYANNTTTNLTYNGNSQITGLSHNPSNFVDLGYTYDKEENPITTQFRHHTSSSEQYSYDKLGQLTNFKRGNTQQSLFNYDGVGNRKTAQLNGVTATYAVNNMNAYSSIVFGEQINHTYDTNGNLTSDGDHNYSYDPENRIISINNGTIATYTYDALGRRIKKVTENDTIHYFFDGLQIIEERDGQNSTQATYVWGAWLDDIVSMHRNGVDYYYHTNTLGSIISVSDSAGTVVERYEYDAFGKLKILNKDFVEIAKSTIGNSYTYTGRQYDPESGLYYYRARYYDPLHGHFLQRDPLGYADGMGLYAYVSNMPTTLIDPLGMEGISFCNGIDDLQNLLTLFGNVPVIGEPLDLLNAVIYAGRGQFGNAALSGVSALPGLGNLVSGGRLLAKYGDDAVEGASNLWKVGPYNQLNRLDNTMDAHHVGQQARMKELFPKHNLEKYDPATAPSILVPRIGHTRGQGVLSRRKTDGNGNVLDNVRNVISRDIKELRKKTDAPNSALRELIKMNKDMYPKLMQIKKPIKKANRTY